MDFTIPPEPVSLKRQFQAQKREVGLKFDSLVLWFGNKLPSYLWKEGGWSSKMKEEGYSWQGFLKIISLHKKELIRWSAGSMTWKELLLQLQETISDPLIKKLVIG
jgi:hypothetical protein